MNTINVASAKKSSLFKRVKSNNKRLVKILEHKMFKGFRDIKKSKECNFQRPKYIDSDFWENKILDPFDDYYNIEYKKKNLSAFNSKDFTDMLQINNYSKKSEIYLKKEKKKRFIAPKTQNNFRKNKNRKNRTKQNKDQYFYFSSNSSLTKNDLDNNNKERKNKLFKTIFSDENEKGLYNDIPIFAIEKIHKIKENKKKKNMFLPSREERINDLQFLYKVSHDMPKKKIDFRNKYNIKSATQRRKLNIMKNAIISSFPRTHNIQSAKSNKNKLSLEHNKSATFTTTIRNNNNLNGKNNLSLINNININNTINKENNNELDYKLLYNTIVNRAKSNNVYHSRNFKLVKKRSMPNFRIKNNHIIYKEKSAIEVKPRPNNFPCMHRFINDQIYLNYINMKKIKFEKLKNKMNID
jgi:hypothetical protein